MASKRKPVKQTVQKALTTTHDKHFKYSKGDMQLSFSLNDDDPSEMRDFLDLLIEAQRDVEESIKELSN